MNTSAAMDRVSTNLNSHTPTGLADFQIVTLFVLEFGMLWQSSRAYPMGKTYVRFRVFRRSHFYVADDRRND